MANIFERIVAQKPESQEQQQQTSRDKFIEILGPQQKPDAKGNNDLQRSLDWLKEPAPQPQAQTEEKRPNFTASYFGLTSANFATKVSYAYEPSLLSNGLRVGIGGMAAGLAAYDLVNYDWNDFKSSWENGTPDRLNTTLNVGGDLAMLAGSTALLFGGSKYRTAASYALGAGTIEKGISTLVRNW